jgi:hypothetical protein
MDNQEHIHHMMDLIERLRAYVRDEGFVPAVRLAMKAVELGWVMGEDVTHGHIEPLMQAVAEAKDIHTVEYTNSTVSEYRVKDLYYFNPHKEK